MSPLDYAGLALYFAAGIAGDGNVEDHGLLGSIQVMQ